LTRLTNPTSKSPHLLHAAVVVMLHFLGDVTWSCASLQPASP
jgi:hypothetical protein